MTNFFQKFFQQKLLIHLLFFFWWSFASKALIFVQLFSFLSLTKIFFCLFFSKNIFNSIFDSESFLPFFSEEINKKNYKKLKTQFRLSTSTCTVESLKLFWMKWLFTNLLVCLTDLLLFLSFFIFLCCVFASSTTTFKNRDSNISLHTLFMKHTNVYTNVCRSPDGVESLFPIWVIRIIIVFATPDSPGLMCRRKSFFRCFGFYTWTIKIIR